MDISAILDQYGETVTHQTRSLTTGSRDAETGYPPVVFTDTTIQMYITQLSSRLVDTPGGVVNEVRLRGYTTKAVSQFDRIIRDEGGSNITYEIEFTPDIYKMSGVEIYRRVVLLRVT